MAAVAVAPMAAVEAAAAMGTNAAPPVTMTAAITTPTAKAFPKVFQFIFPQPVGIESGYGIIVYVAVQVGTANAVGWRVGSFYLELNICTAS